MIKVSKNGYIFFGDIFAYLEKARQDYGNLLIKAEATKNSIEDAFLNEDITPEQYMSSTLIAIGTEGKVIGVLQFLEELLKDFEVERTEQEKKEAIN